MIARTQKTFSAIPRVTVVSLVSLFAFAWVCVAAENKASPSAPDSVKEILRLATIAAANLQTAIIAHISEDAGFRASKQDPEDKRPFPNILVKKDGSIDFDETPGQRARDLMEDIRQGLHQIQAAEKARGIDPIALAGGRESWPKLRDISCRESPGIRYYDLDGIEQYCPENPSH